jgi:hypothetical protein
VRDARGEELLYMSQEAAYAPFPPSSFDRDPTARRLNLDLRSVPGGSDHLERWAEALDAAAIRYISENSSRLLKKDLSPAQVEMAYTSCLKRREGHKPLLRVKLDQEGPRKARYWTAQSTKRSAPEPDSWRNCELKVRLQATALWIMGTSFGLTISVKDIQVVREDLSVYAGGAEAAEPEACPWGPEPAAEG